MSKQICQIYLNHEAAKKVAGGYPWIFADQITNPSSLAISHNSDIAHLYTPKGIFLGSALIDKDSKLAFRLLSPQKIDVIDSEFFKGYLRDAALKRDPFIDAPYYRLINYEGDGLGGLSIDRFGGHFRIESTLEFYFLYKDLLVEALTQLFDAESIIMNFADTMYLLKGNPKSEITIEEGDCKFWVDILQGQKTGWYYDQRENRLLIRQFAPGAKVLDCFCYSGGFGINALKAGARHVTFIDSSNPALLLAEQNILLNEFAADAYTTHQGDALHIMHKMKDKDELFNLIILDPPPFIKNKKNKPAAIRKYQNIASIGLNLLKNEGYMLYSCCSHHMHKSDLRKVMKNAAKTSESKIVIIKETTHAFDHPTCKSLSESVYLNSILVRKYAS